MQFENIWESIVQVILAFLTVALILYLIYPPLFWIAWAASVGFLVLLAASYCQGLADITRETVEIMHKERQKKDIIKSLESEAD